MYTYLMYIYTYVYEYMSIGVHELGFFYTHLLTINVLLFKKMRDIIDFLGDNNFISPFEGHFKGVKKVRPP